MQVIPVAEVRKNPHWNRLIKYLRTGEHEEAFSLYEDAQYWKEVRRLVWKRDGGKCSKCGTSSELEFDHIIPVSKGGANTAKNIELLCMKCNRKKGDLIV